MKLGQKLWTCQPENQIGLKQSIDKGFQRYTLYSLENSFHKSHCNTPAVSRFYNLKLFWTRIGKTSVVKRHSNFFWFFWISCASKAPIENWGAREVPLLRLAWGLPKVGMRLAWGLHEVGRRSAWGWHEVCMRSPQGWHKVCMRLAWGLPKVGTRSAWGWYEVCMRLAWGLPEVWPNSKTKSDWLFPHHPIPNAKFQPITL